MLLLAVPVEIPATCYSCSSAPRRLRALLFQHMQSHVEFRTGFWHEASQANLRAVALPDSDATYPDHNMDMLMYASLREGGGGEPTHGPQRRVRTCRER